MKKNKNCLLIALEVLMESHIMYQLTTMTCSLKTVRLSGQVIKAQLAKTHLRAKKKATYL
ncbi:MAG TPA: hypothetical protein HPP54_09830 [Nitrospinae bacterium]|nr:hypothetical protein [Nitrospinota bacterium]